MSRYIDADALINDVISEWGTDPKYCESNDIDGIKAYTDSLILERITKQPTVDAVQVVRCGECKWAEVDAWWTYCKLGHKEDTTNSIIYTCTHDFYCADGERRTDEQQT